MANSKLTIEDLLNALKDPSSIDPSLKNEIKSLTNNSETWERIGKRDGSLAAELGIDKSELAQAIQDWIDENPYSAIS
jgi:hypothetical protein